MWREGGCLCGAVVREKGAVCVVQLLERRGLSVWCSC